MDVAGRLVYRMLNKQDQMLGKQDKTIESISGFRAETIERFDTMNGKYGKVSKNLERISNDLHALIEFLKSVQPK